MKLHSGVKYHLKIYPKGKTSDRTKSNVTSGKRQPPLLEKAITGPKSPTTIQLFINTKK